MKYMAIINTPKNKDFHNKKCLVLGQAFNLEEVFVLVNGERYKIDKINLITENEEVSWDEE